MTLAYNPQWKNRTHRKSPHIERPEQQDNEHPEQKDNESEETLDRAAEELRTVLEAEVLARVRNVEPTLVERAVVDLLIARWTTAAATPRWVA